MMKRSLMVGLLMIGLMGSVRAQLPANTQAMKGVPIYYGANTNFPMVSAHMSFILYMDRTSGVVLKDDGHILEMAVNSFLVNTKNGEIVQMKTQTFRYDRYKGEVYIKDKSGMYRYINPKGSSASTNGSMQPAEALYFVMTGQKFLGAPYFNQTFYDRL